MDPLTLIVVILLVLWLVGAWVVPVGGSLVHLILVIVVVLILIRIARGQRIL